MSLLEKSRIELFTGLNKLDAHCVTQWRDAIIVSIMINLGESGNIMNVNKINEHIMNSFNTAAEVMHKDFAEYMTPLHCSKYCLKKLKVDLTCDSKTNMITNCYRRYLTIKRVIMNQYCVIYNSLLINNKHLHSGDNFKSLADSFIDQVNKENNAKVVSLKNDKKRKSKSANGSIADDVDDEDDDNNVAAIVDENDDDGKFFYFYFL